MTRGTLGLLFAGMLALPATACAEAVQGPQFVRVRVGLAGRYQVGTWTPLDLCIRGGSAAASGTVTVTVPDDEGAPSRFTAAGTVRLEPDRETVVRLCVRFGRPNGSLIAEFRAVGADFRCRRTFTTAEVDDDDHFRPALDPNRPLVLVIGGEMMGLDEALSGRQYAAGSKPVVVRIDDVDRLPAVWYAYEGVPIVAIGTSRPELWARLGAAREQLDALDQWVRMGGRLLLGVGAEAQRAVAAGPALARFLPGRLQDTVVLHQTGPLETYSGSSVPVPVDSEFRVSRLTEAAGQVELREADLPLVVRSGRGFGQVLVLAADLDRAPLARWAGRAALLRRLLELPAEREEAAKSQTVMHYGFHDMAGQMRKALDRFPGVQPGSFWLVALLIVAYIALIGPVDYFLLRRFARHMEWTWVTFPLLVIGTSVAAYGLAVWFKGDRVRVHQVDLVDVDQASGLARGTTWASVFSPQTDTFDLSARPLPPGLATRDPQVLLGWLGLSGSGLGGMSPRTIGPPAWAEPYDFSTALDALRGLPIHVWATRSLAARWTATAQSPVQAELIDEDHLLLGTIASRLEVPLERCVLAYGHWMHDLGTLEPGSTLRIGGSTRRSEIKNFLTRQRIVSSASGDKYHPETTPYDLASVDPLYILQAMMFFEAAGGAPYTGLVHGHQEYVDLSPMLSAGRAILVGVCPSTAAARHGTTLLRDGRALAGPDDPRVTVYRFVLPVKGVSSGS